MINYDYGTQFATTLFNIADNKSISFDDIQDDFWANLSMESIELSFFTHLYDEKPFSAFLPFEYLEECDNSNFTSEFDFMNLGKLK